MIRVALWKRGLDHRSGTSPKLKTHAKCCVLFAALAAANAPGAVAQTFTTVYSFNAFVGDARVPTSKLMRDAAGNLYGTTLAGGASNLGTVFKIDRFGKETLLHSFQGSDGSEPFYGGLIMDLAGNLYGTTSAGGSYGNGTVFKLDPSGNETVLHSFQGTDGDAPYGGLIRDWTGNLYGTTSAGGSYGSGTVFKLDPSGNETVLHDFQGADDGATPYAALIMDLAGNLYGTTVLGGSYGSGTVFKVNASGNETVLHSFQGGADGINPYAGLIMDHAGRLYGTTDGGGTYGAGTVFRVEPSGKETVLHSFEGNNDGANPDGGLVMDWAGDLFGTTVFGGGADDDGTVFMLDPNGKEFVLHSFQGRDGFEPFADLITDPAGNLFGTTNGGGSQFGGTVFKIDPFAHFTSFNAKLDLKAGPPAGYQLLANLTQPSSALPINPLTQGMVLSIGPYYTLNLPGYAFMQIKKGSYVYENPVLQVRITQTGVDSKTGVISWEVQVDASRAILVIPNGASITLTLGYNIGTTTL